MDRTEKAREKLLEELDEVEWDLSEESLDKVAERIQQYFGGLEQAKEFVEENASYLFYLMEEEES